MPAQLAKYTPEDKEAVVEVLTASFATDPISNALYGSNLALSLPIFFGATVTSRAEETHVLKDDGKVVGVVVWGNTTPGFLKEEFAIFSSEVRRVGLWQALRSSWAGGYSLSSVLGALQAQHNSDKAYIKFIGVDATSQGKGYGSKMINESCKLMASTRTPCTGFYLESSNPRSVPFYERNGFTAKEAASWWGCTITPMVRDI